MGQGTGNPSAYRHENNEHHIIGHQKVRQGMGPYRQYGAANCHKLVEKANTGDQYKTPDGCGYQVASRPVSNPDPLCKRLPLCRSWDQITDCIPHSYTDHKTLYKCQGSYDTGYG